MDLMGRKMRINGGAPFTAYRKEIENFCRDNQEHPQIGENVKALAEAFEKLAGLRSR